MGIDERNLQVIDIEPLDVMLENSPITIVILNLLVCVCVCVCVFFPFILDFNGRTSRGHTGRR